MREFLETASYGFRDMITETKTIVFFFTALFLLWFWERKKDMGFRYEKSLLLYTTLLTIACICPITAGVFMWYQTRFYEYRWIWSLVPVTFIISYVGSLLFFEIQKKQKHWFKMVILLLAVIGVLFLGGGLTGSKENIQIKMQKNNQKAAESVFAELSGKEKDIYLWAESGILGNARLFSGQIRLLYGRDMWDIRLRANAYDTYSEEIQKLYRWIEIASDEGILDVETEDNILLYGRECIELALQYGVNTIVIPESADSSLIETLEEMTGTEAVSAGAYLIFCMI